MTEKDNPFDPRGKLLATNEIGTKFYIDKSTMSWVKQHKLDKLGYFTVVVETADGELATRVIMKAEEGETHPIYEATSMEAIAVHLDMIAAHHTLSN